MALAQTVAPTPAKYTLLAGGAVAVELRRQVIDVSPPPLSGHRFLFSHLVGCSMKLAQVCPASQETEVTAEEEREQEAGGDSLQFGRLLKLQNTRPDYVPRPRPVSCLCNFQLICSCN